MDFEKLITNFNNVKKENKKELKRIIEENNIITKYEFAVKLRDLVFSTENIQYPLSISCENEDGPDISVGVYCCADNKEVEYSKIMEDLYLLMNDNYKGKIKFSFDIKEDEDVLEKTLKKIIGVDFFKVYNALNLSKLPTEEKSKKLKK